MVGSPKCLTDLRKIDASLRVTCRSCGRVRTLDRERLIADLTARGRNLAWEALPSYFRCRCGAKKARVVPVPFEHIAVDGETLVHEFIAASDELRDALKATGAAVPELLRMSSAREAYEAAKNKLLEWVRSRS